MYEYVNSEYKSLQRLGECLGKGSFGVVYKGLSVETGEVFAVKQMRLLKGVQAQLVSVKLSFCSLVHGLIIDILKNEVDLLKTLNVQLTYFHFLTANYFIAS